MITGDYPATARKIAEEAGLDASGKVLAGHEMETLPPGELRERVKNGNIFCRATPEQKLQLVNALKENGEIVAMTGDGVNDAPALKSAHIGIAMGERGTDVARESAALVLLNDDFSSIVCAVRLGRRIFDNIRKAVVFIVAAHIPIAGLSLIPVMLGWPLMLLPIHIVFFELMVDPICSVAFENEPEEKDVMTRPPRPTNARIFDKSILWLGVKQGIALLAWVVLVYWAAHLYGFDTEQARTLTFTAMIAGDILESFIHRIAWTKKQHPLVGAGCHGRCPAGGYFHSANTGVVPFWGSRTGRYSDRDRCNRLFHRSDLMPPFFQKSILNRNFIFSGVR